MVQISIYLIGPHWARAHTFELSQALLARMEVFIRPLSLIATQWSVVLSWHQDLVASPSTKLGKISQPGFLDLEGKSLTANF